MAGFNPFRLVEQTGVAAWVREDALAFPVLEAVHVSAVMLVFGSICMMDLRLLGAASLSQPVTRLSDEVLPWTWTAFAVAVVSGSLLMSGQAGAYAVNAQFQLKMALMLAAGCNMALFHFGVWRGVDAWDRAVAPPARAKLAGFLSLALWIGVIVAGRWVGWTFSASPF
ncbi:MAG: hypothetical protein JWO72_3283 [Caulobacteraceae bacterium]|nr:hypothetical protein [Caulobacteraceae bacterium]